MDDCKNLLILVRFCLLFGSLGLLKLSSEQLVYMYIECYIISLFFEEVDVTMIQDRIIALTDTLSYSAAIKLYEKWLEVAAMYGDQNTEGKVSLSLGLLRYEVGNFQKAMECFKRCLVIAKETGNTSNEIEANFQIGQVCGHVQEDEMAIKHYEEYLKLYDLTREARTAISTSESEQSKLATVYVELANLYYNKRNYQKAIDFLEKAIPLVSDILSIDLNGQVGSIYEEIGDMENAISYCKKSVDIALDMKNPTLLTLAYSHLGNVFRRQHDFDCAFECYQYKLAFALDSKDKELEFSSYLEVGEFFGTTYRFDEAFEYYSQCLDIARELDDEEKLLKMNLKLGLLFYLKCDYHSSIVYYQKSLKLCQQKGNKEGEGIAFQHLAKLNVSLGKYQDAIQLFQKALDIANQAQDDEAKRDILRSLGILYDSLGKKKEATKYLEQLLLLPGTDDGELEIQLQILDDQVCYCLEVGDDEKAKEYSLEQLDIATKAGSDHDMLRANATLASITYSEENLQDAIQYSEKFLSLALKINDKTSQIVSLFLLGNCYFALRNYEDAISHFKESLKVSTMVDEKSYENNANTCLGISYYYLAKNKSDSVQDMYNTSATYLKDAIKGSDWVFYHLYSQDDLKISVFKDFTLTYSILTEVLVVMGEVAEALLVSDRGRGRGLSDLLISKYQIDHKDAVELETPLTKYEDVQAVVLQNNISILYYVISQSLIAFNLSPDKPVNFKVVHPQGMVDLKNEVLENDKNAIKPDDKLICELYLETLISTTYKQIAAKKCVDCENRSLNAYKERGSTDEKAEDETDDGDIETKPDNLAIKQATALKRSYKHPLEELFDMLITSAESDLTQEEVVIVPQGLLYLVPFAALRNPTTGQYLYESKRIRLVPSIATLKTLQECPSDYHLDTGALVIGNPSVGEVMLKGQICDLPDLPQAEIEANLISYHLNSTPLIGSQATKEEVKRRLAEGVGVIHIAAHADSRRGEIALAPTDAATEKGIPEEEDFLLTMKEVQEIGIHAKLVVLSCCHSGRGDIEAEGVVGMTRAFLAAGARSVVASLWAIKDSVTLSFMTSFYDNLIEGHTVSKSLQNAIREIREEGHEEPKCWAPFFLLGDDVKIF